MGYDVTNTTSVVELVIQPSIPVPDDLQVVELPDVVPVPDVLGIDSITPVGTIVELPTTLPAVQLVGMDTITPTGDVVELPRVVPPDGVILLDVIAMPTYGQARGVERLIELLDVDTTRIHGDALIYNSVTEKYYHTQFESDLHYIHTQVAAITTWSIAHYLGKRPAITVVNGAGKEVKAEIVHTDENNAQAIFGKNYSGVAYCN
jgi:hypothetical protein